MINTKPSMKENYKDPYNCPHCSDGLEAGTLESPLHLMSCSAYKEYRQGINPELEQKDRPGYLRKVIARRKELELKLEK